MILVYRRHKIGPNSRWHFHTQCPQWLEIDFDQARLLEFSERDRICPECIKLEARMFPDD